MISANNKSMQEAGETLYTLSKKDQIRYQCEARQEYQRIWNTVKLQMEDYRAVIAEKDTVIDEKDSTIARLETQIIKLQQQANSVQK